MALRIEEALSLKWEDWKGDYFTIYGKTKKYDDLLVSPALQHKLNTMKREGEYLFPLSRQAVNRELKKRAKDLGINKVVSSHIFRRSFATVAIEQGIQRDFVQQRMRHRNSSSLDKYIRKSKRHQREVLQRHPFTVDSMSQEDKVSYIREKQRELEDEMRRLGVTGEMITNVI
jgi:integrase